MFTGIVEAVGVVTAVKDVRGGRSVTIRAPAVAPELAVGASVAVDGACLTVVQGSSEGFQVDVVGTTLARTVAGGYRQGSRVNLERALRLGDRLDGHLVQGHVDGVGELVSGADQGEYRLLDLRLPSDLDQFLVPCGSVTLNGVSLTVNALPGPGRCQVAIIPHTWARTNLADLRPGDPVNVEADLIGKYVGRIFAVRDRTPEAGGDAHAPREGSTKESSE